MVCPQPDGRRMASRTVRRSISVVLSRPFCGTAWPSVAPRDKCSLGIRELLKCLGGKPRPGDQPCTLPPTWASFRPQTPPLRRKELASVWWSSFLPAEMPVSPQPRSDESSNERAAFLHLVTLLLLGGCEPPGCEPTQLQMLPGRECHSFSQQ